jgi:hypothetical protein
MQDTMLQKRLDALIKGGRPARMTAGLGARVLTEAKWLLGSMLNRAGVPGSIKPLKCYDHLTGTNLEVQVQELYIVVSVDGNDYYCKRLTGKYDGSSRRLY